MPSEGRARSLTGMRPQPLFVAATTSYAANCALGAAVAARVIDTRRIRWVHHALYIATCVLAGAAAASAVLPLLRPGTGAATTAGRASGAAATARTAAAARRAALALSPAAVPLVVIPRVSARTARHPLVALSAAPFFVAGLILSRRS